MVGYDPYAIKHLSSTDYVIAGLVSGFATRFFCQPADVIKIRFQLQTEPIKNNSSKLGKYSGLRQAVRLILKEESYQAFWKGHAPAQALSVVFGVVNFQTFEFLTEKVWQYLPAKFTVNQSWNSASYFLCGSMAGCVATAASYPFDVIRTRLIGQGEPKQTYRGMLHGFSFMLKAEGPRSFYKGHLTTLLQIVPNAGFHFGFYKLFTNFWSSAGTKQQWGDPCLRDQRVTGAESFICGAASGLAAKTLTYSMDLIKKRLQVIGFESARIRFGGVEKYTGLKHALKSLLIKEGFSGGVYFRHEFIY